MAFRREADLLLLSDKQIQVVHDLRRVVGIGRGQRDAVVAGLQAGYGNRPAAGDRLLFIGDLGVAKDRLRGKRYGFRSFRQGCLQAVGGAAVDVNHYLFPAYTQRLEARERIGRVAGDIRCFCLKRGQSGGGRFPIPLDVIVSDVDAVHAGG